MEFLPVEIIKAACTQYINSRSIEENLDLLRTGMQELSSRQTDVIISLNTARVVDGKKPKAEVNLWLENVEKITSQMTKLEEDYGEAGTYFSFSRVALGKRVVQKIEEVMKLKEKGRFPEGLLADLLPESGSMPATKLVGRTTAERTLEHIRESLNDHEVRSIGVYGMGGVGKTTIMTNIYNELQSSRILGTVFWVTVSNDSSIERLQNGVAKAIGLDLSNDDDEMRRSSKLFEALKRREKCVIIFDDVWNPFPLGKVGISGDIPCKIVLTTRLKHVCRGMECKNIFEVQVLPGEEAWELFKEKLGADVVLSSEVEPIAKLITDECGGLPLGIITVARAMREKDDIQEWRNALEELKSSKMDIEGMDDEVFRILKFSYDRLKSDRLRSCFLYCALFPEDNEFSPEDLVKYWIAEGLIDDVEDWEKKLDKGRTILNKLIDVCMLMTSHEVSEVCIFTERNDDCVVMHDLIRDLAIGLARKSSQFVVKVGMGIRGSIGVEEFNEDAEKVSLMRNKITKLSGLPNCPKLSTLLLQQNFPLRRISAGFFNHMTSLRVLDLSDTGIQYLSKSFSNLENLRLLLLRNCMELSKVPSLAKLKSLRALHIRRTGIKEVPHGMECLVNLQELLLKSEDMVCFNSTVFPDNVVRLYVEGCDLSNAPSCLSRLQCLQLCRIVNCIMEWLLPIGDNSTITSSLPSLQTLVLKTLPSFRGLCEGVLPPASFACLKHLTVSECRVLENLMSLELFQHLQCLQEFKIQECSEMEEVIKGGEAMVEEEGGNNTNNNTILLPNLKVLYLGNLRKLRSVCKRVIICPSLIEISINGCVRLKKIPLSLGHSTSIERGEILGSKEWWDALEWDDLNTKTFLLPFFEEDEEEDEKEEEEKEEDEDEEEAEDEEEEEKEGRGMKRKAEQEDEEEDEDEEEAEDEDEDEKEGRRAAQELQQVASTSRQ